MSEILVNEYRGGIIENTRRGYVCVVDENKKVVFSIGNANNFAFYRAASKPIQLLPVIKRKLDLRYNFTEQQTVVLASSHNGEDYLIEALEEAQVKAGLIELDMVLKPTYPLDHTATEKLIREGKPQRKIYHNCAGKHTALLLLAREYGPGYQNYWKLEHPTQQEVLEEISYLSDCAKGKIVIGGDGCGVPVFAVPIKNMAISYLKLACPDLVDDQITRDAIERFTPLINKHNKYIRGTNRLCSVLNEDKNIICKDGTSAVLDIGLKKERLGIAIKVEDGCESDILLAQIVIHLFEKLNYENKDIIERLKNLYTNNIYDDRDEVVGSRVAEF